MEIGISENLKVIRLTKHHLILTENELLQMLKQNPEIWGTALRRGKGIQRHEAFTKRLKGNLTK